MNKKLIVTVLGSVALGLVYFGVVMGIAMGSVMLNARISPGFVWFPLPATIAVVVAMWLAQRYWDIGLRRTAPEELTRVYMLGLALTILGVAACAVQGKFTGYMRATELLEIEVSPLFKFTYALYMSVFAAVLAEATFRGVVQTRMQTVLGVWPLVIVIGLVNVFAHRWGPEITQNGLGLFVILAGWTYLRWISNSLWPPLIMHAGTNLIVALGLWYRGPLVHSDLSAAAVAAIAVTGLAALGLSVLLARGVGPTRAAGSAVAQ